jgi:hypothetical protein
MEVTMRAEELLQLVRHRPFVPLRVHMTDGKTYDIRHPDQIMVLRQRVDIGVPAKPGDEVAERVEFCSLLHVVRVEEIPANAPPGETNGPPSPSS